MRFLISLFLFVCSFAFGQVQFESDFETAVNKSAKQNKFLFIEYYNPNCPVCMALEPFFEEKEMADFYNKHFINYKMNSYEMSDLEQAFIDSAGLKFKSVPFFLFFDSEGDFMHHSGTQKDLDYLIGIGKSALNSFARSSGLEKKYNDGDRSVRTLYAYCTLLHLFEEDSLIRQVSDDLFDAFDPELLPTKKSYTVTKKCVNHPDNGFFKFWVERIELMEKVGGCEHGEHKDIMQQILLNAIQNDEFSNLDHLEDLKSYVIKTGLSNDPDAYLWRQEARLLAENEKEQEAFNLIMKIADKGRKNVAAVLYPLEYGLQILSSSSSLKGLNMKLDQLNIDNVSAREQIKWNYLKYIFYLKIEEEVTAQNHVEQIKKIAQENDFSADDVNSFLKKELIR
jgi:thiol-disulfide isomerase/thioredoxin